MPGAHHRLDLTSLGSGNAFGPEGRAFSSFLLNGAYLFDCGPTVLQQLNKLRVSSQSVEVVIISHFHGDHFLGLPFLYLDAWHAGRTADLRIVGPKGIEERAERLFETAYPRMPERTRFRRLYTEVRDGVEAEVAGLRFTASRVDHVAGLECFAYRVELDGRSLVFSGDSVLCDALLKLVPHADVLVLECSYAGEPVHLSPTDVAQLVASAGPDTQTVLTHLDRDFIAGPELVEGPLTGPSRSGRLHMASDLARFSF